ncbi:hypothetical protein C4K04_1587 [Pseudomonas chlororaphis]|jgi:hypothetical protein|uniref:Uncharacterized protein n=1 Tax=Pseudomonas chlororaphis TaxID=587753 RepID=A0A3G7TJJ5_9PSED|nr:hypothetical protein [Pseudomonas chlororaphis]AZE47277.1 hypothetical protein C4K04_1587 [Pseudomonas chlororaphis]
MDRALIDRLFVGLSEGYATIGATFRNELGVTTIPFLCESQQFLALYQPISYDPETERAMREFIGRETGHSVSNSAYLMKFASAEQYLAGNDYAPITAQPGVRMTIRYRIPSMLASVTQVFLDEVSSADELYFVPGGTTDDVMRAYQLGLWYSRVADRICVTRLGLQTIHPNVGEGWYGYRKETVVGNATLEGGIHQEADEFAQSVVSAG